MMKWAPSSPEKSIASSVRFTASARVAESGETSPPRAEPRIEVESRRDAVDGVVAERVADVVEVLGVELLRIVELVVVDEISQPVDRAAHALGGRLARPLRLVAARDEARDHRPEGPYPE